MSMSAQRPGETDTLGALERIDFGRRDSVATEVTQQLIDYLLAGHVKPGERIASERRLCEVLGVGRSVVREALKALTLLGLLEVRQGDGTYLKRTDSELLPRAIEWGLLLGTKRTRDLIEARQHLEVIVAGLAAERRDEVALTDLRSLMAKIGSASEPDAFVAADVAFHLRIAEAAGNETLYQIMSSIRALLAVWVARVMRAAGSFGPSRSEHVAILDAIERSDPGAARLAMEAHLAAARQRLEATLPRER